MATKRTVVQNFEDIKAMLNGETVTGFTREDAIAFIEKRIEITKNKNAKRSTEPTPKQLEKMAVEAEIENAILGAMVQGTNYTPSDLVKLIARADVVNPQKITPRLTALVEANKVVKATEKGRSVYSLPLAE